VHLFLPIYFYTHTKRSLSKNFTFRYINDVLSLNNKNFSKVKDTADSPNSVSYLDLYLKHDINGAFVINVTILTFLSSTISFSQ